MPSLDHQESYLKPVLDFIGLSEMNFIRADGIAMGDKAVEKAIAQAKTKIGQLTT